MVYQKSLFSVFRGFVRVFSISSVSSAFGVWAGCIYLLFAESASPLLAWLEGFFPLKLFVGGKKNGAS